MRTVVEVARNEKMYGRDIERPIKLDRLLLHTAEMSDGQTLGTITSKIAVQRSLAWFKARTWSPVLCPQVCGSRNYRVLADQPRDYP